jgi:cysteine desulfurase
MRMIYLDNAASTRPFDDVVDLVAAVMREEFANPSSAHPAGAAARRRLDAARAELLAAIGDPGGVAGDLLWTSGGSEGDALGVIGAARARPGGGVVVSALEHEAVLRSAQRLAHDGHPVAVVAAPGGVVDVAAVADAIGPGTAVVAVMRVQNEIGTIQPVEAIARAARDRAPGVHVHCDAVQALGKIPVDVAALGCDSVAFAGHKLHGPKATGALWLRHGARIEPLWGGGGQQAGLRSGTLDVAGAAGLGRAAARTTGDLDAATARWRAMTDTVLAAVAQAGVDHAVVAGVAARAPHVLPLALRGIPAAALRNALASRGVANSAGSACAERDAKPSRVLTEVGLDPAWGMVRVSFGHDTELAEVAAAASILAEVVGDLAPARS